MLGTPKIRLEVEHMRYTVIHAIEERSEEFKAAVDAALTKAFDEFDVNDFIATEIDRQMKHVVQIAIGDAMGYEFRSWLQERFRDALSGAIKGHGVGKRWAGAGLPLDDVSEDQPPRWALVDDGGEIGHCIVCTRRTRYIINAPLDARTLRCELELNDAPCCNNCFIEMERTVAKAMLENEAKRREERDED